MSGERPTEKLKQELLDEAGYRCECMKAGCPDHEVSEQCPNMLRSWKYPKGVEWHPHRITSGKKGGKYIKSNCRALCVRCHRETDSYGTG